MKPAFMDWGPLRHPPFPKDAQLALEAEATYAEVYKNSPWKKKILFKFASIFGYMPDLAFQKEDVDWKTVEKFYKEKELLGVIQEWVTDPDYDLLPKLKEAKRVFERIQRPDRHPKYFRGFNFNHGQQNSGLKERYRKMRVGEKWEYTADKPLSFSWHEGTTKAYGNIIVSIDGTKNASRLFQITHELVAAMFYVDEENQTPTDDFHIFTYAEAIFLPDGKPLEFTLVKKG